MPNLEPNAEQSPPKKKKFSEENLGFQPDVFVFIQFL